MGPKKSAAIAPQHFFSEGDKVMAADGNFTSGGKLYAAQIIRAHKVDVGVFKYLVHYNGWKRKFDVWMEPMDIALASDAAAVQKLQEQEAAKCKNKAKNPPTPASDAAADGKAEAAGTRSTDRSKLKRDHDELLEEDRMIKRNKAVLSASDLVEEKEEDVLAMAGMDIPAQLKKKLVNEHSLISEKDPKRLLRLPRLRSVRQIFAEYLEMRKSKDKEANEGTLKETEEFCESLKIYFDRALPVILLYRHEREQYANASSYMNSVEPKLLPCDVYGGEHLNRLFVRLAKMLTGVVAKAEEMTNFQQQVQLFLKFFDKNSAKYFVDEDYKVCTETVAVGGFRQEVAEEADEASSNSPTKGGSSSSVTAL